MTLKRLIFISGTMGVGKTSTSKSLLKLYQNSVFLDGDWCWYMDPFNVNAENKQMVIQNIQFLINAYLKNSQLETIIFCWVMHEQKIIDEIIAGLHEPYQFHSYTLMASPQVLCQQIQQDINCGLRTKEVLIQAQERLPFYQQVDSKKIWIDQKSAVQVAEEIFKEIP